MYGAPAQAQATRTWVSGVGDDANPCSRTAPCKTWAGAISKTAAGGEIDVIDPGGFGALTITKAITLDGGGGQVASTLAASTNGIVVAAGAADVVIIRNVRLNGIRQTTTPGLDGIRFQSGGALIVEKCEIFGWGQNGIHLVTNSGTSHVSILDTTVVNNALGGIQINPTTGGTLDVTVSAVQAVSNSFGIGTDTTGGGSVTVTIDHTTASENTGNGIQVLGTANAVNLISASTMTHNGNDGLSITSPAVVASYTNNVIGQNGVANVGGTGTLSNNPLQ
jgi:hypothetical protein